MEIAYQKQHLNPHFISFIFKYWLFCGTTFEVCHMFINTLVTFVWKYCLKRLIQVINDWYNHMTLISFVLICVVSKVKVYRNFLVSCSRNYTLNMNVIYQIIPVLIRCSTLQLAYTANVTGTTQSFHFLGIGEKVLGVLMLIAVALLNKQFSQNL